MQAEKAKLQRLIKTARGQLDGILKMMDEDRYCLDISNQLLATQAILRKANQEIIASHLDHCVKEAFVSGDEATQEQKRKELMAVLNKMTK